jgi:hypothetical protein
MATAAPPPSDAARTPSLREWAREHDESWIFVVLYLGLAVGLSVLVSLFWLLVVAGLHFALELVRQAHYREGRKKVFLHALWEVKLDVGLVLLALTLVLYIEVVLGILGIQSAARAAAVTRAGARVGARAAAWERNLRTFLLTFDEMLRVGHAGVMLTRKRMGKKGDAAKAEGATDAASPARVAPAPVRPRPGPRPDAWSGRWKLGDRIGVALVGFGILLIGVAPLLTHHDWGSARSALVEELRPFPGAEAGLEAEGHFETEVGTEAAAGPQAEAAGNGLGSGPAAAPDPDPTAAPGSRR